MAAPSRTLRTEAVSAGLLAARVAAGIRRAIAGTPLQPEDRVELVHARDALRQASESIKYAASGGTSGGNPPERLEFLGWTITAAVSGRVDQSVEATGETHRAITKEEQLQLAQALRVFSDCLTELLNDGDCEHSQQLLDFFERLASVARNESGQPGDLVYRGR